MGLYCCSLPPFSMAVFGSVCHLFHQSYSVLPATSCASSMPLLLPMMMMMAPPMQMPVDAQYQKALRRPLWTRLEQSTGRCAQSRRRKVVKSSQFQPPLPLFFCSLEANIEQETVRGILVTFTRVTDGECKSVKRTRGFDRASDIAKSRSREVRKNIHGVQVITFHYRRI